MPGNVQQGTELCNFDLPSLLDLCLFFSPLVSVQYLRRWSENTPENPGENREIPGGEFGVKSCYISGCHGDFGLRLCLSLLSVLCCER